MRITALAAGLGLFWQIAGGQQAGAGRGSFAGGPPQPGISSGGRGDWGGNHWRHGGHQPPPRGVGMRSYPSPGYSGYGSPHGYGNVVFPGTPGAYSPFSIVDPTFGSRWFNNVSGFGSPYQYGGYYGPAYGGGTVVVPYTVPVYVPVAVDPPQPPTPMAPSQIIYIVAGEPDRSLTTTAPSSGWSVVTYVVPARDNAPSAAAADSRRLYLIALRSGSIYSATEYWLEDDTLHYLTSYGAHNQASLDQLDLELTTRLNRERGLEFRLGPQR